MLIIFCNGTSVSRLDFGYSLEKKLELKRKLIRHIVNYCITLENVLSSMSFYISIHN